MALDDIQLDIIVTLQGGQNIKSAISALNNVARSANAVRERSQALQPVTLKEARTWDGLRDALTRVEQRYDAVYRAGMHLTMMGQGLVSMSERIARAGLGVVDAYEDYDLMLRRGAVALNTNHKWQGKLDQAIQQTARSLGLQKPEEVAEGYYIWGAAAGVVVDTQKELNEITAVVKDTMIATAMAGGTLEGNLNGVYGVLAQFNLPAKKATDVVHKLALMTERTAAQFPDLINSLSYIGPLAESIGVTFEDVTSILGVLADAGQKGSRAGRGLSMVLEGMSAPSDKAKSALDGVVQVTHGLKSEWEKVIFPKGEFVGMRDMVIELAKGLDGATDAERGRFYATAFTNNATRALIPVIEDQIRANREAAKSGKEITSVLDGQKYALDGAGEFFENMKDKALGSITAIKGRLTSSFFPVIQTMAKTILKMALPAIEKIGALAVAFGDWLKEHPQLVKFAVKIAMFGAAALAAAGFLFLFAGAVTTLMANLGNLVLGIGRVMLPFGLLMAAIVGIGVAIWNNVGGIRDALSNFVDAVGDFLRVLFNDGKSLKDRWVGLWDALRESAEFAIGILADALNIMADGLRAITRNKAVMDILRGIADVFLQFRGAIVVVASLGATLWAAGRAMSFFVAALKILSGYSTIVSIISGIRGAVAGFLALGGVSGIITGISGALAGMTVTIFGLQIALAPIIAIVAAVAAVAVLLFLAWQNNWFGIRDITANVVNWLVTTFGGLVEFIGGAIGAIVGFFTNLLSNIGSIATGVAEFFANLIGFIASIPGRIADFIGSLLELIGQGLKALADNWTYWLGYIIGFVLGWIAKMLFEAGKFVVTLVRNIVDWISKLPGRFAQFFGQVASNLATWFLTTIPKVATWASELIAGIVDWVAKLPGRAMRFFGDLFTNVMEWFGEVTPKVANAAWRLVTDIVMFFIKMPGRIVDAVKHLGPKLIDFLRELPGKMWDALINVGKRIIEGIWSGISGAWDWFTDQVGGFFDGLIQGAKDALEIQSPSRVFADIGSQLVAGMALGISGDGSAAAALQSYSNRLVGIAERTDLGFSSGLAEAAASVGDLSFTADGQRTVRIEMDLTSSDGTYSDATLEQLKAALTGTDLVRALERMAEAG